MRSRRLVACHIPYAAITCGFGAANIPSPSSRDSPKFLSRIADDGLRAWISELNGFWKQLGREVTGEVYLHPERYSLIFVPNPVVVPGGRFREFYYW